MSDATALVLPPTFREAFPTMADGIRQAWTVFSRIHSFRDIETELLKGAGLAPTTYANYLEAVKQFYSFTEGLHPLSVRPCHVESWYDDMLKRGLARNTARLRVAGLTKFFAGIRNVPGLAFYQSPFDTMTDKLTHKLHRTKKGGKLPGLSKTELNRLLGWILEDDTMLARQNHAIIWFAVVSALRAREILSLTFSSLEQDDETGKWYAVGTGKGDKDFRQEIGDTRAVDAVRAVFHEQHHRKPQSSDALFWTAAGPLQPLGYHALWVRIVGVGERAKAADVIKRDIRLTPHTLRRTAGKILDKAGASLVAIQAFLRHSNIQTTTRYIDNSEPMGGYFAEALA